MFTHAVTNGESAVGWEFQSVYRLVSSDFSLTKQCHTPNRWCFAGSQWLTIVLFTPAAAPAVAISGASTGAVAPFVAVCGVCGVLAAVVMDFPMSKQTEGFTPAYIAASVLARSRPSSVEFRSAFAVHHVAGAAAGVLYALVYLVSAGPLPGVTGVGGVSVLPHLLATLVVAGFIYAFFAHLVLPRRGRGIYEERATAVRGQWLRSVVVFGGTVAVVVPAATSVL